MIFPFITETYNSKSQSSFLMYGHPRLMAPGQPCRSRSPAGTACHKEASCPLNAMLRQTGEVTSGPRRACRTHRDGASSGKWVPVLCVIWRIQVLCTHPRPLPLSGKNPSSCSDRAPRKRPQGMQVHGAYLIPRRNPGLAAWRYLLSCVVSSCLPLS